MKKFFAILGGFIGAVILILIGMAVFRICPPSGPWPMPPWCNGSGSFGFTSKTDAFTYMAPGQAADFFKNPVVFANHWKLPSHDTNTDSYMDALSPGGVTWIHYHFDNNFIFESIAYYHSRNIPIIGASMTPGHTNSSEPDPERDRRLAALDINGDPITLVKPGMGIQEGRYRRNILEPEWQQEMIDTAKRMVDAGIQGINFDEVNSNANLIYDAGGSFDALSMAGFQQYLTGKYSQDQLREKFDINDINAFNFKEYILNKGLADTWNKDQYHPLPLTFEFYQFQLSKSDEFFRRFERELSEYAQEKYNRDFFLSYNASPIFLQHTGDTEYLDYLTGEQFYFMGGGTFQKSAGVTRLAEAQTKKFALLIEVSHDRGTIPNQTKNLYKYIFGDVYAAGGEIITSANYFLTFSEGWNYASDQDSIQFDPAEAGKYIRFMRSNLNLFGLERPAKIALVNSYASRKLVFSPHAAGQNYWNVSNDLFGVTEMLLDLNVPFKVLASGDTQQPSLRLTTEALNDFQIVILPYVEAITDEEVQALIEFTERGGKVLQFNTFGLRNIEGQLVNRPELAVLRAPGEHVIGNGKWWTQTLDLRSYYMGNNQSFPFLPTETTKDNSIYKSFLKTLSRYYSPEIISDGPITVNVHRYQDDSRMVLHLVNYDYDQTLDEFHPAGVFTLTVEPLGKEYTRANLYSFEDQLVSQIPVETIAGKIVIQVPGLYSYAIVELLP